MRRFIRVTGIIFTIVLVFLGASVVFIHTPAGKRRVFTQIRRILTAQGVALDAARFDYNLLTFRISSTGLSVRSTLAPDLPNLFAADDVMAEIDILQLLHGRYRVKNAVISNPKIQIVVDEQGRSNIPSSGSTTGGPVDFLILKLRLSGGSIRYEDRSQNVLVSLPFWDVAIDGNALTGSQEIQFQTRRAGEAQYNGKTITLQNLGGRLVLKERNQTADIQQIQLASDVADVVLGGTISNLSKPQLDLSVGSKIRLQRAAYHFSIKQRVAGDLNVDVSIKGPANAVKVAGRTQGENLTAEMLDRIALNIEFAYDQAAQRAQLKSFNTRSPGIAISVSADVALRASAGASRVDARLDVADLQQISNILKLPVAVASRATGNAHLRWPSLDFAQLDGDARIQLSAQRVTQPKRIPVAGAIGVKSTRGTTIASVDSLEAGPVSVRGQLGVRSTNQLTGNLQIDTADTGQALKQVTDWLGSALQQDLHVGGAAGIEANLGGTLERPQVTANLHGNALQVNELKDIDLDAVAVYTPEEVDLQKLLIQWREESLTASGRLDLKTPNTPLEAHAEVPNASVHRILEGLGNADFPADGRVTLDARISGTIANPSADVRISAADLQAYSEAVGRLEAEAHFENDVLRLDNLTLDKSDGGQLRASGHYEVASGAYSVAANGAELKLSRLLLPNSTTIRANLTLDADSKGTLTNPGGFLKLNVSNLQVNSESLGSIDLDANLANSQARISLSAPAYALTADALVATQHPYATEVEMQAKDTDLSKLPFQPLKALSGRVSATVKAAGDLSDMESVKVEVNVPQLALNWRDRSIINDGPIDLRYSNHSLDISRASVRMEDSTLRISGSLPLRAGSAGELKIEANGNPRSLSDLAPSETGIHAEGQLNLDATLRGNLTRIDPEATITLTGGSIGAARLPMPVTDLNVKAITRDGRLVVEQLEGEWASAKFTAGGEIPFALLPELPIEVPRPPASARLSAELRQLKVSELSRSAQDIDGLISLRVDAEAARPDIDLLQAKVTFPDLRLNAAAYSLEQVGTSTIEVRDGVATVQQFELKGPQTNLHLAGSADLRDPQSVDLKLEGATDAAVIALFDRSVRATGAANLNLAVAGTLRQPSVSGFVEMQDGQALIRDPRIALENLQVRLDFNRDYVDVARLDGSLNGGSIKGEGRLNLSESRFGASELKLTGDGIYLDFPTGVRTVSNAKLNLAGDFSKLSLSGNIDIVEGTYSEPLTIGRGLLRYMESERNTVTVTNQTSALNSTQLDIGLKTLSPLVINNNIARASVNAELRVLGTVERPGVTGKIDLEDGAELTLRERKYSVDRGVITFINDRGIEPVLDISATTKAAGYDITMQISGDATRKLETVLTSEPPMDETDIVSVLATGRTREKAGNAGATVAKEQLLSYVAGELGTSITDEAGRALGLSQVRIEPNLIANEAEPTARLTVGKDITPKLDFVYSMNLRNSTDQIWIADYDITRRFSARGLRQNDNSYRFQFQHDLFFGLSGVQGKSSTSSKTVKKIGAIQFSGDTRLTQKQLSGASGLKTGKAYDFFAVQRATNRLTKTFESEGRLETRISANRQVRNSTVDLTFRIKEGPKVEFAFEGWNVPDDMKSRIRDIWSAGVIDAQRVSDAVELIENELILRRYFGSHVETSIEMPDPDSKKVIFKIQPGTQYNDVRVAFEGIQAVKEEELQALLKTGGFFERDPNKRQQAPTLIENLYKERGYIDATVEPPRNELNEDSKTVQIVFRVTEGPLYRFGQISFEGNTEFTAVDLRNRFRIAAEAPFQFKTVQETQQRVEDLYRKTGYNDVVVQYTQVKDVPRRIVDVSFKIDENQQRVLSGIEIEGNQKTSTNLVRTQIDLKPGEIVSYDKLSQARSNLYNTGAYSFVEITATPLEDRTAVQPHQTPVRLVGRVRELQPWQLRYGGFFDTERGVGGIIDFSNHNMLGGARVVGVQTRYDADLHEVRSYFSQPTLRRFPLKSVFTAFQRREIHTGADPHSEADDFITDRTGFSPSLEYRLRKNNVFMFGYRLEETHTFDRIPDPVIPFDVRLRVAPLTSSFIRDTRNDPLDASNGRFTSHAFEWGLSSLGSQLRYVKYFGQYFAYLPFGEPTVVPWVHTTRNRLVLAMGARIGLASGLGGQEVIPSERFLAGGGTTVRGFGQDTLGPLDAFGAPIGGNAMLVFNTELRFPLYKFFDGVAFVDAGNVYRHLGDFTPFDLRASYGVGLRIRTPYIVLRLDYGLKFRPRPGESPNKFFGSIGQAF